MKSSVSALLVIAGLLWTLPAAADEAKTYTLKMRHPSQVGAKSHDQFKMTSEQSKKVSSGGKKLSEDSEDLRGELSGVTEVLELSPHGKVRKLAFTVETFKCQNGVEEEIKPFETGTVITAKLREDGTVDFTANGKKVDETAAKVLKAIFDLSKDREKEADDDLIFGTDKPHAVGSEWEINKAEAIKSMAPDLPFKVTEKDLSGKVRFAALKVIDGAEHALIQVSMDMKPTGIKGLPSEFKPGKVIAKIFWEKLVPIDGKRMTPSEKMKMEMHFDGTIDTPNGVISMEAFIRQEKENQGKQVK